MSEGVGPDKKISRRDILLGTAAVGAASALAACGPSEQNPAEKKPEVAPNREIIKEKLSDRQERRVQNIIDDAIDKYDTMGKVLFEVQNGALPKNYRQFVILKTYGTRYTEQGMDFGETIIARRDELLKSDSFKRDFLRALLARGYFKPLTRRQEDNLYKHDEAYSNFRYQMWMEMSGARIGDAPGGLKPEQLNSQEFEASASRLGLSARYYNSSRNGVSFKWYYSWRS